MENNLAKTMFGCFGFFLLFALTGILTNLYRSYSAESARTQRLTLTESIVVKWEPRMVNNGREQYPYAQCTVRFTTQDGTELERPVLTEFDHPTVDLDKPLSIVYDPINTHYVKSAEDPDEWPRTRYYTMTTILMLVLISILYGVQRSGALKRE